MNVLAEIKLTFAYIEEVRSFNNTIVKLHENSGKKVFYLSEIVSDLIKTKISHIANKAFSYYDNELGYYVYCGIYPFNAEVVIPFKEDKIPLKISLKVRYIPPKYNLLKMELFEENGENLDEQNQNMHINEKSKRSKERKIGYIIEKVFLWRKLYNGYRDDDGNLIKLTLEEAADKVGISKKSLDDYLIQLRIGKTNGFNFNEHKNEKVGVLRAFVKKQKAVNENKYQTSSHLDLNADTL